MNGFLFFATGLVVGFGALFALALKLGREPKKSATSTLRPNRLKLLRARQSLAQIANRQSIGEARRIANKALREIDE